jgi:hypothetical protein
MATRALGGARVSSAGSSTHVQAPYKQRHPLLTISRGLPWPIRTTASACAKVLLSLATTLYQKWVLVTFVVASLTDFQGQAACYRNTTSLAERDRLA